jgi:hypothetical protein
MDSKTNWASHIEWITLMITVIGGVYVIDAKIDRQISEVRIEVTSQSARTDRLYEMFIDLVREKRSG